MGDFYFFYPRRQLNSALTYNAFIAQPNRMPARSEVGIERISDTRNLLTVHAPMTDSGSLYVPYADSEGCFFFASTTTLPSSSEPFSLFLELSRAQLSRLLQKQADWRALGFHLPRTFRNAIRKHVSRFAKLATSDRDTSSFDSQGTNLFESLYNLSKRVNEQFLNKVLAARRNLAHPWPTRFGFSTTFDESWLKPYDETFGLRNEGRKRPKISPLFQSINLNFAWSDIEKEEGVYDWTQFDAALNLASSRGLHTTIGPLVRWGEHAPYHVRGKTTRELNEAFRRYVDALVLRDGGRSKRWIVATNVEGSVVRPQFETRLTLAAQSAFVIKARYPKTQVFLGFEQPFGDAGRYSQQEMNPFELAFRIVRKNVFDGFYLELNFGFSREATVPRDVMETHSFFDRWCGMGVPLCLAVSCPSAHSESLDRSESTTSIPYKLDEESSEREQEDARSKFQWSSSSVKAIESQLWDEKKQRETIRRFLSSALSRRCVDEILWTRWADIPNTYEDEQTQKSLDAAPTPMNCCLERQDGGAEIALNDDTELELLEPTDALLNDFSESSEGSYALRDGSHFPQSGLFDEHHAPKSTLHKLAALRRAYLD